MPPFLRLWFDEGALGLEGPAFAGLGPALWDERSRSLRAPAYRYAEVLKAAEQMRVPVDDPIAPRLASLAPPPFRLPEPRPHEQDVLHSLRAFGGRAQLAIPRGPGRPSLVLSLLAGAGVAAALLCPGRAELAGWVRALGRAYPGPIAEVGGLGEERVGPITVMTFEGAYRVMERVGDCFGLLVIDEAGRFGAGLRTEALERSVAPIRVGLLDAPAERGAAGEARLRELIGPLACEIAVAPPSVAGGTRRRTVRLGVALRPEERAEYDRCMAAFGPQGEAFFRKNPGATLASCLLALPATAEGRAALSGFRRALSLACLPHDKRSIARRLVERHEGERLALLTALPEGSFALSAENLLGLLYADAPYAERARATERARRGKLRVLPGVTALEAETRFSAAVLLGGAGGAREPLERVARALGPSPAGRSVAYGLFTAGTMEEQALPMCSGGGT